MDNLCRCHKGKHGRLGFAEGRKTSAALNLLHLKTGDDKFAVRVLRKDQRTTNRQRYKTNK